MTPDLRPAGRLKLYFAALQNFTLGVEFEREETERKKKKRKRNSRTVVGRERVKRRGSMKSQRHAGPTSPGPSEGA